MLKALQQNVKVGTGGKIELIVPECLEGSDVQVIVLLDSQTQHSEPGQIPSPSPDQERPSPPAIEKIQAMVRRYVPEEKSLVDELIAERRREADRE